MSVKEKLFYIFLIVMSSFLTFIILASLFGSEESIRDIALIVIAISLLVDIFFDKK